MNRVQFAWPPFTPSVIGVAVTLFLFWFGSAMIQPFGQLRDSFLLLDVRQLGETHAYWSVFTHAWFEPNFVAVLFASLAAWLFGSEIEKYQGPKHFWKLVIVAILVSGLVVAGLQWVLPGVYSGWGAPLMALIAAYARGHWRASLNLFFFPMTGRTLLLAILGINVGLAAFSGMWLVVAADLVGAAVGLVLSRRGGGFWRDLKTRVNIWKARRHLKLVRTPETGKPNGKKTKSKGVDRRHMN